MDFSFLLADVATGEPHVYAHWLLFGALYTAGIALAAMFLALVLGTCLGVARTLHGPVKWVADGIFEVIRAVPFLAQCFAWFFVVPVLLFPEAIKSWNQNTYAVIAGTLALGLFMSCRVAVQVYAGIQALPASQLQAAKALGFTTSQAYARFLVPMAMRNIVPTLQSEAMNTVKNTAVLSTIGVMELTRQAQSIVEFHSSPVEPFIAICIIYLILNFLVLTGIKFIDTKIRLA